MGGERRLGLRRCAAAVALLGLLAACSPAAPDPAPTSPAPSTPGASVSSTATPSATPTPTPSAAAPLGDVPVGEGTRLQVEPVDYDGTAVVVARFGKAAAGRPVSLQRRVGESWQEVAVASAGKAGRVEFLAPPGGTYRAVAAGESEATAVATPSASADDQWRAGLADDFAGDSLKGTDWDKRNEANYNAGGRSCSAAFFSNVTVADDLVQLRMTKETRVANQRKARAAGCTKGEYYRNAMISTEGRYTIRSGMLAARVKFPVGQGMHGSIWLQSYAHSEIDMIESYGYGKGVTSVMHRGGKQYPGKDKAWVAAARTSDRAWWDEFHVVSARWGSDGVEVRLDGEVVQRITTAPAKTDYFLVLSLLSSDWELGRLRKPSGDAPGLEPVPLPAVMEVDWVRTWEPR